ncbi:MAG: hypothetical protein QXX01_03035 [Candidatus Aenigmatarchaeota archaeon]
MSISKERNLEIYFKQTIPITEEVLKKVADLIIKKYKGKFCTVYENENHEYVDYTLDEAIKRWKEICKKNKIYELYLKFDVFDISVSIWFVPKGIKGKKWDGIFFSTHGEVKSIKNQKLIINFVKDLYLLVRPSLVYSTYSILEDEDAGGAEVVWNFILKHKRLPKNSDFDTKEPIQGWIIAAFNSPFYIFGPKFLEILPQEVKNTPALKKEVFDDGGIFFLLHFPLDKKKLTKAQKEKYKEYRDYLFYNLIVSALAENKEEFFKSLEEYEIYKKQRLKELRKEAMKELLELIELLKKEILNE